MDLKKCFKLFNVFTPDYEELDAFVVKVSNNFEEFRAKYETLKFSNLLIFTVSAYRETPQ